MSRLSDLLVDELILAENPSQAAGHQAECAAEDSLDRSHPTNPVTDVKC